MHLWRVCLRRDIKPTKEKPACQNDEYFPMGRDILTCHWLINSIVQVTSLWQLCMEYVSDSIHAGYCHSEQGWMGKELYGVLDYMCAFSISNSSNLRCTDLIKRCLLGWKAVIIMAFDVRGLECDYSGWPTWVCPGGSALGGKFDNQRGLLVLWWYIVTTKHYTEIPQEGVGFSTIYYM